MGYDVGCEIERDIRSLALRDSVRVLVTSFGHLPKTV